MNGHERVDWLTTQTMMEEPAHCWNKHGRDIEAVVTVPRVTQRVEAVSFGALGRRGEGCAGRVNVPAPENKLRVSANSSGFGQMPDPRNCTGGRAGNRRGPWPFCETRPQRVGRRKLYQSGGLRGWTLWGRVRSDSTSHNRPGELLWGGTVRLVCRSQGGQRSRMWHVWNTER